MLFKDGKRRSAIVVNSTESPLRQRFTVAHELGHFVLGHRQRLYVNSTISVNFRDSSSGLATKREEVEANQFAAALLMPDDLVDAKVNELLGQDSALGDEELAIRLARNFQVSSLAMQYRLVNLGYVGAV
jgi:Zn-dependent peptidase ImmA (M78 family)